MDADSVLLQAAKSVLLRMLSRSIRSCLQAWTPPWRDGTSATKLLRGSSANR